MYPENDEDYQDRKILQVCKEERGWEITTESEIPGLETGPCLFVHKKDTNIIPTVGMTVRVYPKNIGSSVRGLFLDGNKVFYEKQGV